METNRRIIRCMKLNVRLKLGRQIKELREKRGFTQEKLSEISSIDYKYIQRIEGKNPPALKIDTLERISKAFNINISKLLDFKD